MSAPNLAGSSSSPLLQVISSSPGLSEINFSSSLPCQFLLQAGHVDENGLLNHQPLFHLKSVNDMTHYRHASMRETKINQHLDSPLDKA